jgi:hypothetical protein
MKSLILYGSPTKLTNSPVGIDQALVKAGQGMMEGETVLNTVPIE